MAHVLINFNSPIALKQDFDLVTKHNQMSKTSVLNMLLSKYCRREIQRIHKHQINRELVLPIAPSGE